MSTITSLDQVSKENTMSFGVQPGSNEAGSNKGRGRSAGGVAGPNFFHPTNSLLSGTDGQSLVIGEEDEYALDAGQQLEGTALKRA